MAVLKTRPNTGEVGAFVAALDDAAKRADSEALIALMSEVAGAPAALWGTMVGFGRYHYRYASGHEGDAFLIGFSPRKAEFSLYLSCVPSGEEAERHEQLLARLGRHRRGKACLYVKRLADIDLAALRELAEMSVWTLRRAYPDPSGETT